MLVDRHNDQADGLRRMFSAERLRVIHVIAGCHGVGRSTVAAHLGVALAKAGRETLLVDVVEEGQPSKTLRHLALNMHTTSASMITGPQGLGVVTLARSSRQSPMRAAQIAASRTSLAYAIVTDCSTRCTQWLPIEAQRQEFIVVLSRGPASITAAYALIKRMTVAGVCRSFHVLINRAGCDAEAALIFRNMSRVARGYLDVDLGLLGFVPSDPALDESVAQGRCLLDACPESPAATAFDRLVGKVTAWPHSPIIPAPAYRDRARIAGAA